jgi:hypothetical protein
VAERVFDHVVHLFVSLSSFPFSFEAQAPGEIRYDRGKRGRERERKRKETHLDPLMRIQNQHLTNQILYIRSKIGWHMIPSNLYFL